MQGKIILKQAQFFILLSLLAISLFDQLSLIVTIHRIMYQEYIRTL